MNVLKLFLAFLKILTKQTTPITKFPLGHP